MVTRLTQSQTFSIVILSTIRKPNYVVESGLDTISPKEHNGETETYRDCMSGA